MLYSSFELVDSFNEDIFKVFDLYFYFINNLLVPLLRMNKMQIGTATSKSTKKNPFLETSEFITSFLSWVATHLEYLMSYPKLVSKRLLFPMSFLFGRSSSSLLGD